jgi:propanol-preferring alcohol dehydrogenase
MDLIEALRFAAEGKVASHYSMDRLENVNGIFDRMRAGKIEGRVVMAI